MSATVWSGSRSGYPFRAIAGARAWFGKKGLTRERQGRWLGGVFAAFARRYEVNILVMRLAGVAAVLVLSPLIYVALWVLMPGKT